jgi:hypothetical protein
LMARIGWCDVIPSSDVCNKNKWFIPCPYLFLCPIHHTNEFMFIDVWVRPRMWNTQKLRQICQITGQNLWLWVMSPFAGWSAFGISKFPWRTSVRDVFGRGNTHGILLVPGASVFIIEIPLELPSGQTRCWRCRGFLDPSWTIMNHQKIMLNRYHYINYIIHITYYR